MIKVSHLAVSAKAGGRTIAGRPADWRRRIVPPLVYGRAALPPSDRALGAFNAPPALGLQLLGDVLCLPRNVFLSRDMEVLPASFLRRRNQVHGGLAHDPATDTYKLRYRVAQEAVDLPHDLAVSIDTDRPGVYGHVLLETFSRLWAIGRPDLGAAQVLTTSAPSGSLLDVFAALGVPASRITQIEAPLRCRSVVVPDLAFRRRESVHSAFFEVMERIADIARTSQVATPERIYISRSRVAGRRLVNEMAVEALLAERGFAIVHPQDLPLPDQIRILRAAREIVTIGGSAAHNAVFARPDCRVLCLCSSGWLVNADILMNRVPGRLGYCFGDPLEPPQGTHRTQSDWQIDVEEVRRAHGAHFRG